MLEYLSRPLDRQRGGGIRTHSTYLYSRGTCTVTFVIGPGGKLWGHLRRRDCYDDITPLGEMVTSIEIFSRYIYVLAQSGNVYRSEISDNFSLELLATGVVAFYQEGWYCHVHLLHYDARETILPWYGRGRKPDSTVLTGGWPRRLVELIEPKGPVPYHHQELSSNKVRNPDYLSLDAEGVLTDTLLAGCGLRRKYYLGQSLSHRLRRWWRQY